MLRFLTNQQTTANLILISSSPSLSVNRKLRKEIELKIKHLSEKPNLLEKTINGQELSKLNDLNLINYEWNGMYHVFDHHKGAVTRIRFANHQKALFACSSTDGDLTVCQLLPLPATVIIQTRFDLFKVSFQSNVSHLVLLLS